MLLLNFGDTILSFQSDDIELEDLVWVMDNSLHITRDIHDR